MNKDLLEKNKKIAQEYAESKGAKNIGEIIDKANTMMSSNDPVKNAVGERIAQETVDNLLLLCLRQELMDHPLPDYMNLSERVFDGVMKEGNQKEYIADLDTGTTTYSNTAFVPTEQTMHKLEQWNIQIYTKNAQGQKVLSPQGYQFKKEITIPINEWLPFFKSNKLNEFITKRQETLNRAYKIYIFNKLCGIITAENGKIINGTANNMFDALLELAPHIDKMLQYNSEYNKEQTSKEIYAANKKDILIFTSTKTRSNIQVGIKSQVYSAQLIGSENGPFSYDNLKVLGSRITQGDQNTINTAGAEWINDTTIIVLDISRIKHIVQVDQSTNQHFARNLTTYITKDVWGAMDILPWCKKLIYKNNNLNTMPTS